MCPWQNVTDRSAIRQCKVDHTGSERSMALSWLHRRVAQVQHNAHDNDATQHNPLQLCKMPEAAEQEQLKAAQAGIRAPVVQKKP